MPRLLVQLLAAALLSALAPLRVAHADRGGQLELQVVDRETGEPIACRMHLRNAARKAQKPPKVPFWHDHFVFDGNLTLKLPLGVYNFEIERGPEYLNRVGNFTINESAKDSKTIDLKRFIDMSKEGWWSADLEVERPAKDMQLLMLADDLHLAEVVGWGQGKGVPAKPAPVKTPLVEFAKDRCYHLQAGLQQGNGGSALIFNLPNPLADDDATNLTGLLIRARGDRQGWVDVRRANSWDLPIWIALGLVDSFQLADSELARGSAKADDSGSRPRDALLFPGPSGVGRSIERVYFHLLNCGLRIPPSAGSGSGVSSNPVGYNRVYAHVGDEFSYDRWFEALRAGRVVVTNGPLIRPNVEGELPGHVFQADKGQELELEVGVTLSTRDKVSYLEVVKDGRSVYQIRLDEWAKLNGRLPPLKFNESGWFVIRAVTDVTETYRFASTGPYYVEVGYQRRISRDSVQYFLDWLDERGKKLKGQGGEDALKYEAQARAFWQDLLDKANAP